MAQHRMCRICLRRNEIRVRVRNGELLDARTAKWLEGDPDPVLAALRVREGVRSGPVFAYSLGEWQSLRSRAHGKALTKAQMHALLTDVTRALGLRDPFGNKLSGLLLSDRWVFCDGASHLHFVAIPADLSGWRNRGCGLDVVRSVVRLAQDAQEPEDRMAYERASQFVREQGEVLSVARLRAFLNSEGSCSLGTDEE